MNGGAAEAPPPPNRINIDEAITLLGGFRQFQWILDAALCFCMSPIAYQILIMVFAAKDPPWRCSANSTKCLSVGSFPSSDFSRCTNMSRSDWEYTTAKDYSISTQFNLQCENGWIKQLLSSVVFVGWALGAFILGSAADNHGRKKVIYFSTFIIIALGFLTAFLESIYLIVISRFIIGFFIPGANVQTYILVSEYVGTHHRPQAGLILFISFQINLCVLALKSYFITKWTTLFMVCTGPYALSLLTIFFVPESIRWLRLRRGQRDMLNILDRVSFWNSRALPKNVSITRPLETVGRLYTLRDIFKERIIASISVILGFTWMVNGMVYYGVVLAADDLGGSMYLNFVLLTAVGIPANLIAMDLCKRIGRKKSVILPMLLASGFCISVAVVGEKGNSRFIRITLGILGKLFINISFSSLYVWSLESYPTTTRAIGMGFLQVTSRVGAATAPWVAKGLLLIGTGAPFIIMGSLSLFGSVFLIFIPETTGQPLIESNDVDDKEVSKVITDETHDEKNNGLITSGEECKEEHKPLVNGSVADA